MEMQKNIPQLRFPEFDGEWARKKMKEVSAKITDGTHDTPKPTNSGIPYLTAIHIKDGFIDYENCYFLPQEEHEKIYKRCNPEKGDLLMVNIGAGTATCAINIVDYEFSMKNIALIKPNRDIINPEFLDHTQRKICKKLFNNITSGGAQPFLSLKEISIIKLSLPTLPEQQKIASFFTAIDQKISQIKRKKILLEQYKKGVMQKIFSQEIRFKDNNGQEFPKWEKKKLGEVAEVIMGQSPDSNYYNTQGIGRPLIQGNADIKNRISNPRNWTAITTKECYAGDLIMTVRAPVGAIAKSMHNACIGRGVCAIRNKTQCNIEFLYQFFLDYELRWSNIEQGSTFTAVSGADIKKLKISIPSLTEQTKIANFLSAIDYKINHTQMQIDKVEVWKKGLMQQMFV